LIEEVEKILSHDIGYIDSILSSKDTVREEIIRLTREIIRLSSEATRNIHLGKHAEALESIKKARDLVAKISRVLADHPDLYYSGLVYNALSEYAEATITYFLVVEKKMPSYKDLNIPYVPYLQGLGDVVGEIRRYVLTLLSKGLVEEASLYLEVMERIYLWLRKLNYPDPLVPGLRHKVDVARRLLEDTRALLINTRNAIVLISRLEKLLEEK